MCPLPMWLQRGGRPSDLGRGDVLPFTKLNPTSRLNYGDNEKRLGRATGRSAQTVSGSSTNGSADWKHLVSRDA
ncbi:hypothetical protein ASPBRDRAFT_677845 [Aspergillus brasiliensis CBS 101740]|uniref:Uncharacterized protein n=1 Tax=Aspergillus brasiliensis (strain CBS 101740 / IMI 381727 / IBT 21946) TaxID=767769 RepID=A0A1L9UGC0_ASPBC|nr:hypothetical protein ASPBRDRAFT_677845 [Aspergillus brasiliensis CBS 101740]